MTQRTAQSATDPSTRPPAGELDALTVFLGADWTDALRPALRFAPLRPGAASRLEPYEQPRSYTVAAGGRRCTGYFDLAATPPSHVTCSAWRPLSSGTQCATCRHREGFTSAHTAHQGAAGIPEHVRRYLAQPHYLYLDVFPDGSSKVGTVAQARLGSRLAEQGAAAACYVARAEDGTLIRRAEADVSNQFGLKQAITTRRKLAALQQCPVDLGQLRVTLSALATDVQGYLRQTIVRGLDVLAEPEPWTPPAASLTVFAAAPLAAYPVSLAEGRHNLVIGGLAGSIAALATAPGAVPGYVADLGTLRGLPLQLSDYAETLAVADPIMQESLF
jgi:hypothetical protein